MGLKAFEDSLSPQSDSSDSSVPSLGALLMLWEFYTFQGFQTFMPCPQGAYDKMLPMQKLVVFILDLKPGHFE